MLVSGMVLYGQRRVKISTDNNLYAIIESCLFLFRNEKEQARELRTCPVVRRPLSESRPSTTPHVDIIITRGERSVSVDQPVSSDETTVRYVIGNVRPAGHEIRQRNHGIPFGVRAPPLINSSIGAGFL
jgi:hypothetical protein